MLAKRRLRLNFVPVEAITKLDNTIVATIHQSRFWGVLSRSKLTAVPADLFRMKHLPCGADFP
jgi:hypothetical protein